MITIRLSQQVPYALSRQHMIWSWNFILALSKKRIRLWKEAMADTVFRSSATKAEIEALARWRLASSYILSQSPIGYHHFCSFLIALYRLVILNQNLGALSRFEDEGKEGQFGDTDPMLFRSKYEHPVEVGQRIFMIVRLILLGMYRTDLLG
jgi:hypothetical protein